MLAVAAAAAVSWVEASRHAAEAADDRQGTRQWRPLHIADRLRLVDMPRDRFAATVVAGKLACSRSLQWSRDTFLSLPLFFSQQRRK